MFNFALKTGAIVALCAAVALPAAAADRKVEIINKTGYTIVEFYASNSDTDSWGDDVLGEDVLPHNATVTIDFDDGTGHCMFDLLALFEDGDNVRQDRVDVCATGELTFE